MDSDGRLRLWPSEPEGAPKPLDPEMREYLERNPEIARMIGDVESHAARSAPPAQQAPIASLPADVTPSPTATLASDDTLEAESLLFQRVEIHSLQSSPQHNGTTAFVRSLQRGADGAQRVRAHLAGGSKLALRPANVRELPTPSVGVVLVADNDAAGAAFLRAFLSRRDSILLESGALPPPPHHRHDNSVSISSGEGSVGNARRTAHHCHDHHSITSSKRRRHHHRRVRAASRDRRSDWRDPPRHPSILRVRTAHAPLARGALGPLRRRAAARRRRRAAQRVRKLPRERHSGRDARCRQH